jgi:hypothetical protein
VDNEPKAPAAAPAPVPTYSPEAGKVAIRDADGSIWKIPAEQLAQVRTEGARPATEAEWVAHKMGTPLAGASAAVLGAGRGLTGGLSDVGLIEGSRLIGGNREAEDTRHALNLAKEAMPSSTEAGEYGGIVGSLAFGGAGAAEQGVVRGGGLAARALSRAAAAAPRAFGEGAAYGVAHQASEDALGDHKFAAENYLAAGFKGGAVGVILGSGLHAGGGVVSDAGAYYRGKAGEFFGGFGRAAEQRVEEKAAALHEPAPAQLPEGPATTLDADGFPAPTPKPSMGSFHIDPDAGLGEVAPRATNPFKVGPKTGYTVGISPRADDALAGIPVDQQPIFVGIGKHLRASADADEGIIGAFAHAREKVPNVFLPGKLGRDGEEASVAFRQRGSGLDPAEPVSFNIAPRREGFTQSLDAGLGEAQGSHAGVAFSKRKDAPRAVQFDPGAEPQRFGVGKSPIAMRQTPEEVALAAEASAAAHMPPPPAAAPAATSVIDRIAEEAALRRFAATGARPPDIRRLGADAAEQRATRIRIGQMLEREVPSGPFTTYQKFAEDIATRTREVGKDFRRLYSSLNGAAERPSFANVLERFDTEVRRPASRMLNGADEVRFAEDQLTKFMRQAGERPSFTRMHDLSVELDKKMRGIWNRKNLGPETPGEGAAKALRGIIRDEMMSAAERASAELGKPIAQQIRLNNVLYKDLRAAKDISTAEAARQGARQKYGMGEMMAVGAAAALGGPLGLALPVANYVRRNFGDQIGAYVLSKASRLEAVQGAANKVDKALESGTRAFVSNAGTKGTRPLKTLTAAEVRAVRDASSNPSAVTTRISAALGDLQDYAPKTAAAFATNATRIATYLAQVLPKERAPDGPMFTGRPPRAMSDSELRTASNIIETVSDPTIVLDRIRQGRLTREHVKALKVASPETYAKIQNYLMAHAAELRPQMTVQQQVQLSALFQKPLAAVMQPANVTALQASFVGGDQAPKGGGPVGKIAGSIPKMAAGPVNVGKMRGTSFDVAEKGGR